MISSSMRNEIHRIRWGSSCRRYGHVRTIRERNSLKENPRSLTSWRLKPIALRSDPKLEWISVKRRNSCRAWLQTRRIQSVRESTNHSTERISGSISAEQKGFNVRMDLDYETSVRTRSRSLPKLFSQANSRKSSVICTAIERVTTLTRNQFVNDRIHYRSHGQIDVMDCQIAAIGH